MRKKRAADTIQQYEMTVNSVPFFNETKLWGIDE